MTDEAWMVEITKPPPLPKAPIEQSNARGIALRAQTSSTLSGAISTATDLIRQGCRVRMIGADGQVWSHEQVVGYINGEAAKRPALRPEDGARFLGRVENVDKVRFLASCRATQDYAAGVLEEEPRYFMCRNRFEAVDWIERQATWRGFTKWHDESDK